MEDGPDEVVATIQQDVRLMLTHALAIGRPVHPS